MEACDEDLQKDIITFLPEIVAEQDHAVSDTGPFCCRLLLAACSVFHVLVCHAGSRGKAAGPLQL